MFASSLQKILKRETYIDQLSIEQISTIQTKQLFFRALQQSPSIDPYSYESESQEQKFFRSPNIDGPATNLLKHILPAPQNSYEEIEQLQNRMKLFNSSKLNQVDLIKQMFEAQKQQIKASGLKVSDFLDIYQSEDMELQDKDINDPLIKKIMTYFETNTKEYSLFELLNSIIEGISIGQLHEKQDTSKTNMMRKIRQSVCSLQGFNISVQDDENQFNEQTKKEMDKLMAYYQSLLQVFDIQNDE